MTPEERAEELAIEMFEIARAEAGGDHGWNFQAPETKESFRKAAQKLLDRYDITPKASVIPCPKGPY